MELNDPSEKDLYARVADIEKCIGDYAELFAALKAELDPLPQPDCPPYCMHKLSDVDETKFSEYQDPLKIEERVRDIGRCIGDHAWVFKKLREALKRMPSPDCPPYCGHEPGKAEYSEKI